jgi:hypothetical protein
VTERDSEAMRIDAQNVCDLMIIASNDRDGHRGKSDAATLADHWLSSPLPTERLAGRFLQNWLDDHDLSANDPLFEIVFDMVEYNGGVPLRHATNLGILRPETMPAAEWTWEIFQKTWEEKVRAGEP